MKKYGWVVVDGIYIMADGEWEVHYQDEVVGGRGRNDCGVLEQQCSVMSQAKHEDFMVHGLLSNEDRIIQLANAVMFMEQTKMNA